MNGECPSCKGYSSFRSPSFGEAGLRGFLGLISRPRSVPEVLLEAKPHGNLWKCENCGALAGECPQCHVFNLGGAHMACRSCRLEFFAGGQG